MSEEEQESVEQEVAQAVTPAEEAESAKEAQKAEAFAKKSQNDQERNWKETRRTIQELERKAKEQEELIQRLTAPKAEEDELAKLGDDDIITYGQHKKAVRKEAKQIAREAIQEYVASTVDERIQQKFPDFTQVVTQENIDYLNENEPEIAKSLKDIADPYVQSVTAYKMMKMIKVNTVPELSAQVQKEKEQAIRNLKKPGSSQSIPQSKAIGSAHTFDQAGPRTKDEKARFYKEMQDAIKGF